MSLSSGTRLGSYQVIALIGAGGMGEVYRARDTRLNRDVALKVLPEVFARDVQRMARFEREAKLLASLNHPNIAAIYGLEESGPIRALVMELVEGPTVAERIAGGRIPVDEALPIARQVADAVEYAHEHNVMHRDLKPANIKVTAEGVVKVLDFGLAKALSDEPTDADMSNSPTLSMAATRQGVILGTAAYMSPEQARGKKVDRRTDVWAFGCVLYEMLTGKQAFHGEDVTEILAAVVMKEPAFDALPTNTPPAIQTLLRRCLRKDRRERLPDAGAARIEIQEALSAPATAGPVAAARGKSRERLAWAAAAVLLMALALGAFMYFRRTPAESFPTRFVMFPPEGWTFAPGGRAAQGGFHPIAVSPDGRRVAFVAANAQGQNSLWVRPLDSLETIALRGTEGAWSPFWSPDSRFLAFFAAGKLKRIEIPVGPATTICDIPAGLLGSGHWRPDDSILFWVTGVPGQERTQDRTSETQVVSASGGRPMPAPASASTRMSLLPDGRHFFEVMQPDANAATRNAVIRSFESADQKLAIERVDTAPVLYSQGHVLFLRDSALLAQPFDARRLEVTGDAVVVAGDTSHGSLTPGSGVISVSDNGVLVYRTNPAPVDSRLSWFDRSGRQIGVLAEDGAYAGIELAPDGSRAAVSVINRTGGTQNLWLYDVMRAGVRTRLTTESGDAPVWSPDGSRVAYIARGEAGQSRMSEKATGGTEAEQVLIEDPYNYQPTSWSRDGRFVLVTKNSSSRSPVSTTGDLLALPLAGDRKLLPILESPSIESNARFSPDGRWVAFQSDETGRAEVYVMAFPGAGPKLPISSGGGSAPRWRRDGREIFYLAPDNRLMAAAVTINGGRVEVGAVRALFEVRPGGGGGSFYDVSADGQRFLINTANQEAAPSPITIVMNWAAGLRK